MSIWQSIMASNQQHLANELGYKLAARIMLTSTKLIVTPTKEEYIGINLLHRDNELPSFPQRNNAETSNNRIATLTTN